MSFNPAKSPWIIIPKANLSIHISYLAPAFAAQCYWVGKSIDM